MYLLTITLTAVASPVPLTAVSGRGLSGLLYKRVLQGGRLPQREVDWLHETSPRPYSMAPIFTNGHLAGLRFGVLSDRALAVLQQGWQQAVTTGLLLQLGPYQLVPTYVACQSGLGFAELQENSGAAEMHLQFVTPTAFKQGVDGRGRGRLLLLPIPANVFGSLFRSWQAFAPPPQRLPEAWLPWCERHILVSRHEVYSGSFAVLKKHFYKGFMGDVSFEAWDESLAYRRIWQALGQFAPYCGVGTKTTMGLGAVRYKSGQ